MKKVLSFVLVLAMILGSVSMAFAVAPDHTSAVSFEKKNAKPFDDAPNSELATVLRDLKVLQGNDGKVFLDQPISRAEVCAILMRVLGYETYCTAEYAIKAASSFKDVASGYWANGYINLAAQLGYVNGVGNGKFNPTGNVGLNDGVAFIMKALGYSADHLPLEWPYNFLVKAEELGMLEDVEQTAGDLTREQVFTMLYNVIDEDIVKWKIDDIGLIKGDATLGNWVNAGGTFATKASGHDAAHNYGTTDSAVVCPALIASAAAAKSLDLSAYEGQYVEFVKKSNDTILFVSKVLSTELSGEYTSKGAVQTFAGLSIVEGAASALNSKGSYILYNGTEEDAATAFAGLTSVAKLEDVTANVVLDKDGKIAAFASVELWIPTKTYKVDATAAALFGAEYDATRAAVATRISDSSIKFYVSQSALAKKTEWEILGVELVGVDKFEDIKENDVITVYADHDGYINRIEVAREVIEGQVSARATGAWTINGKTYVALCAYEPLMKTSNYAFYLDANGYIFAAKNLDRTSVVVPGYSFGFITTYASVYEQHYDAAKLAIVPVTNNSISIMPLGGTEAVSFSNVSQGAMDITWMDGSADGNAKWDTTKTKIGQLVAYKLNAAGGLGEMKLVSNFSSDETATVTDAGLKNLRVEYDADNGEKADANGYSGKLFAADVQIVSVINAAGKMVITNKTVADIQKTTYKAIAYELNAANKICKFFVIGTGSVASTTTKVTAAALTTWGEDTAQYYNALVDGKDAKYVITGEAFTLASNAALEKTASLYELKLNSLGQVTSMKAIDAKGSAAAENCKYAGGVLVVSTGGVSELAGTNVVVSFVNPVIYVYNKVFKAIEEADVAAALKEATNVYVYEFDNDGYYDVLVIK